MLVDEELLKEAIVIQGKTYSIYLGDQIIYKVDGNIVNEWQFKSKYSSGESLWQMMLGSLQTKINMALSLNDLLFEAIAEKYLKEEVLERLTGAGDANSDNLTIIRKAANKRIHNLENKLPKSQYLNVVFISLPSPSDVYDLTINYKKDSAYMEYGELPNNTAGIKCCWNFLQHYDELEAATVKFVELWKPVVKFLNKRE